MNKLFLLILCSFLILACNDKKDPSNGADNSGDDGIVQYMTLVDQSIEDHGEDFDVNTAIELTFSEKIDENSIIINDEVASLNTIVLEDADGNSLPIDYIFGNDTNHLYILPESVLNRGRSYRLTVWANLMSTNGNRLDNHITINFKTELRQPGQAYHFKGAAGIRWETPEKHEATSHYEIAISDSSRKKNGVDPNYTDPNNAYDNVLQCTKSDVVSEGIVFDEKTGKSFYGYHCPVEIDFAGEEKKYVSIRSCYGELCSSWGYEVTVYVDEQEKIIQELTPLIFLKENDTTCY